MWVIVTAVLGIPVMLLFPVKLKGMWGPDRAKAYRGWVVRIWRMASPRICPRPFRWIRSTNPDRIRIARRGILGRYVTIRIRRHILITGITGSGKSCVLIALAGSARALGMAVEFWDSKDGLEGQPYADAGIKVVVLDEQAQRLDWLVSLELPRRAEVVKARRARQWDTALDGPELAVILDELGVTLGSIDPSRLARLIKKARAYGVYIWAGEQLGKASTLDTDIRSQFQTRVALRTSRISDSRVSLGTEAVADGWAPHMLPARWLLVADETHPRPRPARALNVAMDLLTRFPMPVSLEKDVAVASSQQHLWQGNTGPVVYVIGSGTSLVKLGRTGDLRKRLAMLQTGSPEKLEVLWATEGDALLESYLHEAFKHRRQHGEWFALGEDPVPMVKAAVAQFHASPRPVKPKRHSLKDMVAEALMVADGPVTVRALAKEMGKNPGSVHRVMNELIADGAAKKTEDGYVLATTEEWTS